MGEMILAFKTEIYPQRLSTRFSRDIDILPFLLSRADFIDRDKAETDSAYKQVIPYSILIYQGKVFRYKRSAWGAEARLHGLFSIGVGGHINKSDLLPVLGENVSPIDWCRERELREEFLIDKLGTPRIVGLINDESNDVGRVHFGVVYEYQLESPKIAPRERRAHIHHGFAAIQDLVLHQDEYENWSRIIISEYLASNFLPDPPIFRET